MGSINETGTGQRDPREQEYAGTSVPEFCSLLKSMPGTCASIQNGVPKLRREGPPGIGGNHVPARYPESFMSHKALG